MPNFLSLHQWLNTKIKVPLPPPKVKEIKDDSFSGYYDPNTKTIEICKDLSEEQKIATFVHEWRHYWQHSRNRWPQVWKDSFRPQNFNFHTRQYKSTLRKYFLTQPWETDALLFTLRHFPNPDDIQIKNLLLKKGGN